MSWAWLKASISRCSSVDWPEGPTPCNLSHPPGPAQKLGQVLLMEVAEIHGGKEHWMSKTYRLLRGLPRWKHWRLPISRPSPKSTRNTFILPGTKVEPAESEALGPRSSIYSKPLSSGPTKPLAPFPRHHPAPPPALRLHPTLYRLPPHIPWLLLALPWVLV